MNRRINIEFIPHKEHRYSTLGDYWRDPDGTLQLRVSQLKDPRHEILILFHELIEVFLTEHHGIKEADITAFDEAHLDADEPGELPDAPYHKEHMIADALERLLGQLLDVERRDLDADCNSLFEDK